MIQEYLFTSDQYKADLENLSISPKVTKEITTIENSKCWTLLISVPGVSMEAAKILDPLNRKVCENYRPTVLANECSAYFNKALYCILRNRQISNSSLTLLLPRKIKTGITCA